MFTLVPNQTWPYLEERWFVLAQLKSFFGTVHSLVPGCNQKNSDVIQIGTQNIEFPRIITQKKHPLQTPAASKHTELHKIHIELYLGSIRVIFHHKNVMVVIPCYCAFL